jgi:hypothetical protein
MHILSVTKQPIELIPVEAKVVVDERGIASVFLDSPDSGAALVTDAVRALLPVDVRRSGSQLAPPPPPAVFREHETSLLRIAHRDAVVHFAPGTESKHDAILARHNLRVRRESTTIPGQFIVRDPSGRCSGAALVEATNELSMLPEVVFAVPDFVSQFERFSTPATHPAQWHIEAIGALAEALQLPVRPERGERHPRDALRRSHRSARAGSRRGAAIDDPPGEDLSRREDGHREPGGRGHPLRRCPRRHPLVLVEQPADS